MNKGKIETRTGIAEVSKAGLVVDGTMLIDISPEDEESYGGKNIRVKGEIVYDHSWEVSEGDVVQKQGFSMPVMVRVISIDIID